MPSTDKIRPGELNSLVRFVLPADAEQDEGGGLVRAPWGGVITTWVNIRPLGAAERARRSSTQMETTHLITCRYFSQISSKMRIEYSGRVFRITGFVNVNDSNRKLEIDAIEVKGSPDA